MGLPLFVCSSCRQDLKNKDGKTGSFPSAAEANGMFFREIPPQLRDLNFFEQFLIQQVRPFHTVVRLKLVRKFTGEGDFLKALKGLVIHVPLNLEETLRYTMKTSGKTLPSKELLDVIVDSLPTSKNVVWRNLVDMKKVYEALKWLKENNEEYTDINISEDLLERECENDDAIVEIPPDDTPQVECLSELELQEKAHLEYVEDNCGDILNHYTVQSISEAIPITPDTDLYKQKRVDAGIIPDRDPTLDVRAFAHLYPEGKNGMYETSRQKKLQPTRYMHLLLNNVDSRFRKDLKFICHAYHKHMSRSLDQGVFACLHAKAGKMKAAELLEKVQNNEQQLEASLNVLMSKQRGSSEYWVQKGGDLAAADLELGPATWFFTFSCAEYKWSDMLEYLHFMNEELENVKKIRVSKLCVEDPISVSNHFYRRWQLLLHKVIMDANGPVGEVEHFFWRIEYQARGAPHIHGKLWVKDAKILGIHSDEEVKEFIEKYISCRIPPPTESPELNRLVTNYQIHKCNASCLRKAKLGGKVFTKCRYGFPRKAVDDIRLNRLRDTITSQISGGKNRRLYDLPRDYDERYVNDYQPDLLTIWGEGNMDFQYVGESSHILNRYVTSYITKGERQATEDLWEAIGKAKAEKSLASRLYSLGSTMLKKREVGLYEQADVLLGHHLCEFSTLVKYVNVNKQANRRRKLKTVKEVQEMDGESDDIYCNNMIDVYYPNRPDEDPMDSMSLHEVCSWYDYSKEEPKSENAVKFALKNNLGWLKKRGKRAIIKTPVFNTKTDDGVDNYYHGLLMLFKPWRSEDDLLDVFTPTYKAAFETALPQLPQMANFDEGWRYIEAGKEFCEQLKVLAQDDDLELDESDLDEELLGDAVDAVIQSDEIPVPAVDASQLEADIQLMNAEQRKIFDRVMETIRHQEEHKTGMCNCSDEPRQILEIVSGVGGCGKSFLINILARALRQEFCQETGSADSVLLVAPTGIAAYNISGSTLHRVFKLPIQHEVHTPYKALEKMPLKEVRMLFRNVRLVIMDEYSMVSNVVFAMLDLRLQEIYQNESLFSLQNLVMFGDLLQLAPVKSSYCFEKLSRLEIKMSFGGAIAAHDLFANFQYSELCENMRQKKDPTFGALLDRIRLGSPTDEDIDYLKKRALTTEELTSVDSRAEVFNELLRGDPQAVCLMPLVKMVDQFNEAMLKKQNIQVTEVQAVDFTRSERYQKKKGQKLSKKTVEKKVSETAGLEHVLKVGPGARVMLKRNIDVAKGLVNGVIGTIVDLRPNSTNPTSIWIELQSTGARVEIRRVTADFELSKNIIATRSQFPLSLGYAMTIHKVW